MEGKIKIKVIAIVLIVLLGGGAAAWLRKGGGEEEVEVVAADEPAEEGVEEDQPAYVVELGDFLVNPSSDGQLRYVRAELALVVRGELEGGGGGHGKEEAPALPQEDLLRVKEVVVKQLSAQKFSALRGVAGRDKLKESLKAAVDEVLTDYEVEEVLFVSFVMQ